MGHELKCIGNQKPKWETHKNNYIGPLTKKKP